MRNALSYGKLGVMGETAGVSWIPLARGYAKAELPARLDLVTLQNASLSAEGGSRG